eukprot:766054-Hanusia_phi.AAC.8
MQQQTVAMSQRDENGNTLLHALVVGGGVDLEVNEHANEHAKVDLSACAAALLQGGSTNGLQATSFSSLVWTTWLRTRRARRPPTSASLRCSKAREERSCRGWADKHGRAHGRMGKESHEFAGADGAEGSLQVEEASRADDLLPLRGGHGGRLRGRRRRSQLMLDPTQQTRGPSRHGGHKPPALAEAIPSSQLIMKAVDDVGYWRILLAFHSMYMLSYWAGTSSSR